MNNQDLSKFNFKKAMIITAIIMVAIIIVGGFIALFLSGSKKEVVPKKPLVIKQIKHESTHEPSDVFTIDTNAVKQIYTAPEEKEEERIIIPGFSDMEITKEKGYVLFANPAVNKVDFIYTIKKNGIELIEPVQLAPGDTPAKVELYDLFTEGEHSVEIIVETVSDNGEKNNGTTMEIKITKV